MQGASPLASPGAEPGRHWGGVAAHAPEGGAAVLVAGLPRRYGTQGGLATSVACLSCLYCLSCPHPPGPLPGGKGETFSLFRRGWRPRHPCAEPLTALNNHAIQATPRGAEPRRHWLRSITNSRKVLGGLGDSFKSPPAHLCPLHPRGGLNPGGTGFGQ